ncbi:MAG TPA: hypothetical protein VM658_08775 [bacterium]|nr:hypothetical protein [bacterium]
MGQDEKHDADGHGPAAGGGPGADESPAVSRIIFWLLLLYSLGLALMVLEDVLFHTYV